MAFTGEEFYQNAIDEYRKKAQGDLAQQTQQANASADSSLQQAYIQRMQNQQQLNQNLARAGVRGGASETSNLNLMNTYNANRNQINADRNSAITNLQTSYNDNVFNYDQSMKTAQAEYRQNMLGQYYDAKYGKTYSTSELKKALKTASNDEEVMAINKRLQYIAEGKHTKKHGW